MSLEASNAAARQSVDLMHSVEHKNGDWLRKIIFTGVEDTGL